MQLCENTKSFSQCQTAQGGQHRIRINRQFRVCFRWTTAGAEDVEIVVPAQRIGQIVAGKRSITADTDLRLCRFLGLSNGYWLRAQAAHDTEVAEDALEDQLKSIRPWKEVSFNPRLNQ